MKYVSELKDETQNYIKKYAIKYLKSIGFYTDEEIENAINEIMCEKLVNIKHILTNDAIKSIRNIENNG